MAIADLTLVVELLVEERFCDEADRRGRLVGETETPFSVIPLDFVTLPFV